MDVAAEPCINEIYTDIGSNWERLAIALNFDRKSINDIKANNPLDTHNQCHAMLYQHCEANGSHFTKQVLAEALVKASLLATAESHHLLRILKPGNFKKGKLNYLHNLLALDNK